MVQDQVATARVEGHRPGVIPFGGSNAAGARAYEDAGHEVLRQLPILSTLVVAVGSGGTMAGLVAALGPDRVAGVDTGAVPDATDRVLALWQALDGSPDHTPDDLRIRTDLVGEGYGVLSDETREAMQLFARTEGIVLDPVYTGRAGAGLISAARLGEIRAGETTVLLHSGGLPGLFGHAEVAPWRES